MTTETTDTPVPNQAPSVAAPPGEVRELLRLSAPLIAGHAGNQLMALVDTAMVGRLGPAALAGVGVGTGIFFIISVVGMGTLLGLDPLIAQSLGAGEPTRARRALWQGVYLALALSLPTMAVIALGTLLLRPFGIDPETAAEARSYMFGRLPNILPFYLFTACRSYLQAAGGARTIIFAMIAANIGNLVGNTIFIYGDEGLLWLGLPAMGVPALGVFGAGLASSLASAMSLCMAMAGIRSIATPLDPERRALHRDLAKKVVKLGFPIGLQLLAEVGAFGLMSLLAGRMGTLPAAGYQVAITLASFTFTVTLGIGSATGVRVGRAVGRGDSAGARRAGFTGIYAGGIFMMFTAAAFMAMPSLFVLILTDKPEVLAAAIPLVQLAGLFQISDGLQAVSSGALRGAGDTSYLHRANLIGHYAIGLPIAIALGFWAKLGAPGLWWGATAGLTAVAAFLTYRFHKISRGPLARV
ncbi:MAG: MATE family efflux transporter [Polyangiaceae bacterium]|nr:MATE family efflux transporter [Polyangiaceae bacterium]